jgi:anti-sigma factor ChrR (cupin superfamily)
MRWFRSKLHLGTRLALFALAVQTILTFGHVHLGNLATPAAKSAIVAGSGTVMLSEQAPSHDSGGALDTDCPICALIQLAATSVPSVAPALQLPLSPGSIRLQAAAELASASPTHLLFQARAPPV